MRAMWMISILQNTLSAGLLWRVIQPAVGVIIPLFFFPGCHSSEPETILTLDIRNLKISRIVLIEQDPFRSVRLDSVTVKTDGSPVIFHPDIREAGIFALEVGPGEKIVCILHPGENVGIEADMDDFPYSISITGSPDSQWLQAFYALADENRRRVDSLQIIVEESQFDPDFFHTTLRLDSLFSRIWEDQRAIEKKRIRDNPGSLASLLILHYHFGVKPVLNAITDSVEYRLVDSALAARYPGNKHTLSFHQWLQEAK